MLIPTRKTKFVHAIYEGKDLVNVFQATTYQDLFIKLILDSVKNYYDRLIPRITLLFDIEKNH